MSAYKRKILFVITHLELGGAQKSLLFTISGLDKKRYDLYLYAGNRGYLKNDFLSLPYLKTYLDPFLVREISPLFDLLSFVKLFLFIRRYKFDIVHTHSPKASVLGRWAAYFAGVKNIVYTVHGWAFHRFMNQFVYKIVCLIERITSKVTTRIVVVSRVDYQKALKNRICTPDKLKLIHYGVDVYQCDAVFREQKRTSQGPFTIINISSFKPQKGMDCFLEVAKSILKQREEVRFFLFGDGPQKSHVAGVIEREGLVNYIYLKGWRKDIKEIFSKASLFILTSLWEGMPLSVIESVLCGIPVVATDTGGVREIVKDGENGIIVDSWDPKEISHKVLGMLNDFHIWETRISNFRRRIDLSYWSYERMVNEVDKLYRSL